MKTIAHFHRWIIAVCNNIHPAFGLLLSAINFMAWIVVSIKFGILAGAIVGFAVPGFLALNVLMSLVLSIASTTYYNEFK